MGFFGSTFWSQIRPETLFLRFLGGLAHIYTFSRSFLYDCKEEKRPYLWAKGPKKRLMGRSSRPRRPYMTPTFFVEIGFNTKIPGGSPRFGPKKLMKKNFGHFLVFRFIRENPSCTPTLDGFFFEFFFPTPRCYPTAKKRSNRVSYKKCYLFPPVSSNLGRN